MSHDDNSDISDEDAILPAIGVLDDLDSDIEFSDEDDPALQDHPTASEGTTSQSGAAGGTSSEDVTTSYSDYDVKSSFWQEQHVTDSARNDLPDDEKQKITEKAKNRDAAVVAGKFIPCPRFTIERPGYEFRDGEHGHGYYETAQRAEELTKPSAWPEACGGKLRIGLYNFTVG